MTTKDMTVIGMVLVGSLLVGFLSLMVVDQDNLSTEFVSMERFLSGEPITVADAWLWLDGGRRDGFINRYLKVHPEEKRSWIEIADLVRAATVQISSASVAVPSLTP